jgi:hypothetical protein
MEIVQIPEYKRWSNRYSHAFKMEVTEAFRSGQMSQRQVTIKYGPDNYKGDAVESDTSSISLKASSRSLSIPS